MPREGAAAAREGGARVEWLRAGGETTILTYPFAEWILQSHPLCQQEAWRASQLGAE